MRRLKEKIVDKEDLFVGIDLHKQRWHITIRTSDLEFVQRRHSRNLGSFAASIGSICGPSIAVYEAGYFGFRLLFSGWTPCLVRVTGDA